MRKEKNPHPDHILSYSETSPKERGNVVTEKIMKPPPLHIPSCRWLPPKGNVVTKKGKLGNERISKLERDLGRAVGQGRGGGLI